MLSSSHVLSGRFFFVPCFKRTASTLQCSTFSTVGNWNSLTITVYSESHVCHVVLSVAALQPFSPHCDLGSLSCLLKHPDDFHTIHWSSCCSCCTLPPLSTFSKFRNSSWAPKLGTQPEKMRYKSKIEWGNQPWYTIKILTQTQKKLREKNTRRQREKKHCKILFAAILSRYDQPQENSRKLVIKPQGTEGTEHCSVFGWFQWLK